MDIQFKLKTIAEDFLVKEALFIDSCENKNHKYSYFKVMKKGYTTFEAIKLIAEFLNIDQKFILYGGLKDEDGITEQYIAVEVKYLIKKLEDYSLLVNNKRFIKVFFAGNGHTPIQIGEILGNYFKLVIRNLDKKVIEYLSSQKKYSFNFLNYYGTQRFGLPSATKNTHLIGSSLISKNFKEAINLISQQKNEIGNQARICLKNGDSIEEFFKYASQSMLAFFQSAYYSFFWNKKLLDTLKENHISANDYQEEGIDYLLPNNDDFINKIDKLALLIQYS